MRRAVALSIALAACGGGKRSSGDLPSNEYAGEPEAKPAGAGTLAFECTFSDAWVAVLPAGMVTDQDRQFMMQALIGLTEDPGFWTKETQYARYQPYAAVRCAARQTKELAAGNYEIWVGWAGQFSRTNYTKNGHIAPIEVEAGGQLDKKFTPEDMNLDFVCISCPFLAVRQDGAMVELGQILIDRYSPRRAGTDARTVEAGVVDGRIRIEITEREREVTYLDSVAVSVGGKPLAPAGMFPPELRAIDATHLALATGRSVSLDYAAPVDSGSVTVTIEVTGHYWLDHVQ